MDANNSLSGLTTGNSGSTMVSFRLGKQIFALPIEPVRQIIEMVKITPVPQMRDYVEGVVNFHGAIVPVVNLRAYLGLPRMPARLHTPIILALVCNRLMGLLVDEVLDVLNASIHDIIHPRQILPEGMGEAPLLTGMIQAHYGMVMLLNLDQLFKPQQARLLMEAASVLENEQALSGEASEDKLAPAPERLHKKKATRSAGNNQEKSLAAENNLNKDMPASHNAEKQKPRRSRKKIHPEPQVEKAEATVPQQEKEL